MYSRISQYIVKFEANVKLASVVFLLAELNYPTFPFVYSTSIKSLTTIYPGISMYPS